MYVFCVQYIDRGPSFLIIVCVSVPQLLGNEAECCLLDEYTSSLNLGVGSAQLVASQILSTNEGFVGMTVFDYLQRLLQVSSNPNCSASNEHICQLQQKDSLEDNCENSLPLCVRSYSQTSGRVLTQLWQPVSDMALSFSAEESSGHSLQQKVVDDVTCVLSPNIYSTRPKPEPEWPMEELSLLSQKSEGQRKSVMSGVWYAAETVSSSKKFEHFGSHKRPSSSLSLLSTSPVADKLDSPVALTTSVARETLKPISTMSCGYQLKRSFSNYWFSPAFPGLEHNASSFEKEEALCFFIHSGQNASFASDDAPLSEPLGSFISAEPQMSEPVNMDMHESNQATPKKCDCVFTPLQNITNVIRGTFNERSQKRMHRKRKLSLSKPCLPGTPKVSQVPEDSSLFTKNVVSDSLTKNPLKMAFHLERDKRGKEIKEVSCAICPEIQHQGTNEQESPSGGPDDEYNCSADLFRQSSPDVSTPDRTVTDCNEIIEDSLMDRNVSECIFRSFHFAPSLQSTPISYPYNQITNSHLQEHTLSKKCSNSPCSKKQITCPRRIRVLDSHRSARQGPKAEKTDLNRIQSCDFMIENSNFASENFRNRGLTAASDVQGNVEHQSEDFVLLIDSNEWSRDLFAD